MKYRWLMILAVAVWTTALRDAAGSTHLRRPAAADSAAQLELRRNLLCTRTLADTNETEAVKAAQGGSTVKMSKRRSISAHSTNAASWSANLCRMRTARTPIRTVTRLSSGIAKPLIWVMHTASFDSPNCSRDSVKRINPKRSPGTARQPSKNSNWHSANSQKFMRKAATPRATMPSRCAGIVDWRRPVTRPHSSRSGLSQNTAGVCPQTRLKP